MRISPIVCSIYIYYWRRSWTFNLKIFSNENRWFRFRCAADTSKSMHERCTRGFMRSLRISCNKFCDMLFEKCLLFLLLMLGAVRSWFCTCQYFGLSFLICEPSNLELSWLCRFTSVFFFWLSYIMESIERHVWNASLSYIGKFSDSKC